MKVVGGEKTEKGEGKRLAEFPDEAVYAAQLVVEGASTLRGQEALSDFGEGKHPINMFFRWGLAQGKVHSADGSTGRGGHSLYGSGTEAAQEYPNLSGPSGTPAFGAGGGPGQHGGKPHILDCMEMLVEIWEGKSGKYVSKEGICRCLRYLQRGYKHVLEKSRYTTSRME
jgi:hypothetical protein